MSTSLSAVPLPERGVVVFDLDDTLYPEYDFVRSGFRCVATLVERETGAGVYERLIELFDQRERDPFGSVLSEFRLPVEKSRLVKAYREHMPSLKLDNETRQMLMNLRDAGQSMGILTDGRCATQRNKIRALGLDRWIDAIVISEEFGSAKPAERNYRYFEQRFPARPCAYVGDNLTKDFVTPNRIGWRTVCLLDRGRNIHAQDPAGVAADALPHYWIEQLA